MAISEHASGTRTAGTPPEAGFTVLGTTTDTTDGVFQFFVDCANMARGDTIVIQVLEKALSAGTQRIVYQAVLANQQDEPIWVSPSLILMHGWQVQMKQTTGTARSFDWSIRKVA
jgi:hypothetical protein